MSGESTTPACQFGIVTSVSGLTSVYIQSITPKTSVEKAEVKDSNGKTVAIKAYSKTISYDIKAVINSASNTIEAGQTLTIGSTTFLIDSCDKPETNTGFVEINISASTKDTATVTAYA